MSKLCSGLIILMLSGIGVPAMAAVRLESSPESLAASKSPTKLLAQNKSKGNGGGQKSGGNGRAAGRQKIISTEARSTKNNRTKIDFDEAAIDGERKTPVGIAIQKNRPAHDYDLINLRLRWHPEMVESTANLETGKGR